MSVVSLNTVAGGSWRSPGKVCLACAFSMLLILGIVPSAVSGQIVQDVVFTDYTSQASLREILRRLSSPLNAARLERAAGEKHQSLAGQTIDLAQEHYVVYLPSTHPERGFGLLVFVAPWQDGRVPMGWTKVLDEFSLIFVSAVRSGNQENVIGRRVPLALLAAHNIMHRYNVDPQRLYVAGFSGGSRVAMRLALAYPDLFRGALLNAGSDPIGDSEVPLPPRDLLYAFQNSSRIVYATGARDPTHAAEDRVSVHSMKHWCMTNVESYQQPLVAHEVMPAAALARALESLGRRAPPDARKLLACRAEVEADLASAVGRARELNAESDQKALQKEIKDLDDRFGGLAAPQIDALTSDHSL